jgi:predicted ribonuclease toxin of YeeF-YezG toxin-antitoxin module
MNRSTLLLLVALVLAAFGHAADNSEAIIQATKDYVKKETAVKDPLVTVQKVADGYARVQVKSRSGATDAAIAFLKLEKANGKCWAWEPHSILKNSRSSRSRLRCSSDCSGTVLRA